MQILVVEDDHISRRLVSTVLKQLGYELIVAEDGEEAWRMFQVTPVRLVVSDWLMPKMDGLQLCQKIREHDQEGSYTYFICLTANASERENYIKAMEVGVDDFLSKPLDRTELEIRLKVAERILKATSRIESLENVLTICSYTKKIEIPEEGWETIEEFLQKHLGITLTHGISPDHYEKVIKPQLEDLKRQTNSPIHPLGGSE
jgi:sigma-B regulation protein RsbU (phosphoserine phosphatase)